MQSQEDKAGEEMEMACPEKVGTSMTQSRGCSLGEVGAKKSPTINLIERKYEYGSGMKTGENGYALRGMW